MTEHDDPWASDPLTPVKTASGTSTEPSPLHAELSAVVRKHAVGLLVALVVGGALGYAGSFLVTPQFTSTTTFIPPRQQTAATAALASLGPLAGLAGAGGIKTSADEYVGLMRSVTVSDRIIDRFGLMKVYQQEFRRDVRHILDNRVVISIGKKDGLISVSVSDTDPQRAANIANQYVEELRHLNSTLAISEAQQRRVFFEKQMQEAKDRLVAAQLALQETGVSEGTIKTEPRAAADAYAELRAQATAAEVRLRALRVSFADSSPQVQQQKAQLDALRNQLTQLSKNEPPSRNDPDYVGRYREFKYQETLFELMAKQYEVARVDESREGSLVQVIDLATPAELKSSPHRSFFAISTGLGILLTATSLLLSRSRRRVAVTQ